MTVMNLDLTDDESAALAQLLRRTIDEHRYPLSPRLALLRYFPHLGYKAIEEATSPQLIYRPLRPLTEAGFAVVRL
jgi:hypothetical protein